MKNPFTNKRIEFHILQSFPVTCLNRDDVGAPKTAMVGGHQRARVSSQCWKRQVRLEMQNLGIVSGIRTKRLSLVIADACRKEGATEEQAKACGDKIQNSFIKEKAASKSKSKKSIEEEEISDSSSNESNDTLIFLSPRETAFLAAEFKKYDFKPEQVIKQTDQKKQAQEVGKLLERKHLVGNALDIALFGRMVAQAAQMNVEAAASFSHAISTHKVNNEVEFFTALDDIQEGTGAGHMGSLEYNSATYYRYISLDLGQLWTTLAGLELPEAIEAFTKALFIAVPTARQTTMSGASQWDFAKIFVRNKGQRLQLSFESPVLSVQGSGFVQPSIEKLKKELAVQEKRAGSLFGKEHEFTFGEDEFSIDDLIEELKKYIVITGG